MKCSICKVDLLGDEEKWTGDPKICSNLCQQDFDEQQEILSQEIPRWIVLVGNPVDGVTFFGTFPDAEEANAWADHEIKNESWWVTQVEPKSALYRTVEE